MPLRRLIERRLRAHRTHDTQNSYSTQADARMTAYFEIATQFVGMGVRGDLEESQQAFPSVRDRCGADKACILAAYKKQTVPLRP